MKVTGLVVVVLFCGETVNGRALPHHRQDAMTGIKQSCIDEAHRGRCEFFECFNERHPCQSNNYAIDYGWRFCSRYQINMYRLSDSGQRWLNGSRQCTMERLLNFYYEPTVSCGELASIMKDAQAACEVENGLCSGSLLRDNRDVFTDVHNIGVRSVTQFLHATKHCTIAKARMASAWFRDRFEEFMELPAVRDIRQGINFLHEGMMREFKKVGRFFGRYEDTEDVTDWSWGDDDDNRDNGFGIGFDIE